MVNVKTFAARPDRVPQPCDPTENALRLNDIEPSNICRNSSFQTLISVLTKETTALLEERSPLKPTAFIKPQVMDYPRFNRPATAPQAPIIVFLETTFMGDRNLYYSPRRMDNTRYDLVSIGIDDADKFTNDLYATLENSLASFIHDYEDGEISQTKMPRDVDPLQCHMAPLAFRLAIQGQEICMIFGYQSATQIFWAPLRGATATSPNNCEAIFISLFRRQLTSRLTLERNIDNWDENDKLDHVIAALLCINDYFAIVLDTVLPNVFLATLCYAILEDQRMSNWMRRAVMREADTKFCETLVCVAYLLKDLDHLAIQGCGWDLTLTLPPTQRSDLIESATALVAKYEDDGFDFAGYLSKVFVAYVQ